MPVKTEVLQTPCCTRSREPKILAMAKIVVTKHWGHFAPKWMILQDVILIYPPWVSLSVFQTARV